MILENINKIPVRTWQWLHANDITVQSDVTIMPFQKKSIVCDAGIAMQPIEQAPEIDVLAGHIDQSVCALLKAQQNSGYFIHLEKNQILDESIVINYQLDKNNASVLDDTLIVAESGSKATIVVQYSSLDDEPALHVGTMRIVAKEGAQLRIIQTQMLNKKSTHIDYIVAEAADESELSVFCIELGSNQCVGNVKIDLQGKQSKATIHSLYMGAEKQQLDFNYGVVLRGEGSQSQIQGSGVLMDECRKNFRGTLDFLRGATQAVGKESEFVVLLSEKVQNLSVPILLSGESDVQGEHAASAGKIDPEKMFYLQSRGLSELQAKKLIIEAEFSPTLEQIPDETLRATILQQVQRSLENVK